MEIFSDTDTRSHSDKSTPLKVLALGCHPDDIEFMMAGTFLLLGKAGAELHYCNVANGCYGSAIFDPETLKGIREKEGRAAASYAHAQFYPSMEDDLHVLYGAPLITKVASIIRKIQPQILLLPALYDYMEDHMETARIGVTAAFVRSMASYVTDPPAPAYEGDIALYHALPYGLKDQVNRQVYPDFFINITSVIEQKSEMLMMHKSQQQWLDTSQQLQSYDQTMRSMSQEVGKLSGRYVFAEGWNRHNPLGFSSDEYDPLKEVLACCIGGWQ